MRVSNALRCAAIWIAASSALGQAAPDPLAVGKAALKRGDFAAAHDFFAPYVAENPKDVEALFYLSSSDLELRNFPAAIKECQAVVAALPNEWGAHRCLIFAYAQTEDWPSFDRERALLSRARENRLPGVESNQGAKIDEFTADGQHYVVRAYDPLDGRVHVRYRFLHVDSNGKVDRYISCESDDIDQIDFAKRHPKKAAAGERSFSLDSYAGSSQGLILFYSEGEPSYERVRADVLRNLTGKSTPLNTTTINGLEVPQQPDVPKTTLPPPR
jgi:tetratricopeptide (TPR) repeat protein